MDKRVCTVRTRHIFFAKASSKRRVKKGKEREEVKRKGEGLL